jgi:hypothetical protein
MQAFAHYSHKKQAIISEDAEKPVEQKRIKPPRSELV